MMGGTTRTLILIVVGWLVCTTSMSAQVDSWDRVQAAKNQVIRVKAVDGRRATGTIAGIDDTNLSIVSSMGDVARFTRNDVQLVERQVTPPKSKGRDVAKGVAWGAGLGVGLSLGPMMAGAARPVPYMIVTSSAIGAAIGGRGGDPGIWSTIYRR